MENLIQEVKEESWANILKGALDNKNEEVQQKKKFGLYSLLFRRLDEIKEKCNKEIIPFPLIFEKLCRNFSISKKECWDLIFLLRDVGLIEIVPYKGIRY